MAAIANKASFKRDGAVVFGYEHYCSALSFVNTAQWIIALSCFALFVSRLAPTANFAGVVMFFIASCGQLLSCVYGKSNLSILPERSNALFFEYF